MRFLRAVFIFFTTSTLLATNAHTNEVNIYSYRQPALIAGLLSEFTKQTGIKTNVIFAKKGLVERIVAEGKNSPADIGLTVDISRLAGAKAKGITQAVNSKVLNRAIPAHFRDPQGHWFGLTTRGRAVYASRQRVNQENITYEELADPKWKGRICTRSGHHVYTIGLISSMIAHHGAEKAKKWLTGLKANLAHAPKGNDRAQVKSIYAGICDISLGNTYYMGKMLTNTKKPEQQKWAESVRIVFPNNETRGTHVNISGAFVANHAPNKANAIKFMEFLASPEAQKIYAEINYEYPVRTNVAVSPLVASWGAINPDSLPLGEIAANARKADELVDEVNFDAGP